MSFAQFWTRKNWWEVFALLPDARRNLIDLVTVSVTINLLSLAVPLVIMQVYDRIIPNTSLGTFWWLIVGCTLAIVMEATLRWARFVTSGRMTAQFDHLLGCEAVSKILGCRIEEFDRNSVGESLDRLNAVSTLSGFYVGQILLALLDLPFALLYVLAIAYLGGWLVLIPLVLAIGYLLLVRQARSQYQKFYKDQVETNDRRYDFVIQVLRSLSLVKAQTFEEQMLRRYERLQAVTASNNFEAGFWGKLPGEAGIAVSQLAIFAMIAFGSGSVVEGVLTVGGLSACMMLAGRSLQPVQGAAQFWFRFSEAELARQRLDKINQLPQSLSSGAPNFPREIRGSIELRHVFYRYFPDAPYVLKDVSLRIEVGKHVGLVAQNGSGTSTLLYLMMGLCKPESGTVLVGDYNLAEWNTSDMRGRIEYLPPHGALFRGTIIENITMFDPERHEAALEAAAVVGLDEPVALLPMGYETAVDNQASTIMPAGVVQRICFARALTTMPRVLLLDKTTAPLDQEGEKIFIWLLRKLKKRCTVVLVTSQPHFLREMDAVYEMHDGQLIEQKLANDVIAS